MPLKIICFLLFPVFFFSQSSWASDGVPNRKVRAGIFNFDGYHMKDGQGNLQGYGIDLLGLISEYSHLNFVFSGYEKSWQDMLEMLKNGEIDIVTSARRTPEREESFAFSLPVGHNYTLLSFLPQNSRIQPGDYSTYDNMMVGVLGGSSQNNALDEFARRKGFSFRAKTYESSGDLSRALQDGEVDAILSSNLRKGANEKILDVINFDNFYVMARKEDQALVNEINYAIEQMNQNEGDWDNDLYYRYYGPRNDGPLQFTEREKAYIRDVASGKKKIRALGRGGMAPYSYVEDGSLKGILPDYFSGIMKIAHLPYEMVVPENDRDYRAKAEGDAITVTFDRVRPQSASENSGVRGFTTDPYMHTGLALLMRQDFHGPVKRAGIADRNGFDIKKAVPPDVEVELFPTEKEAMEAVKRGDIDAAYVFPYSAQLFVTHDSDNDLYYTMLNDKGVSFRMYVPDSVDHELITILNKSILHSPEGLLNQISARHTSFTVGSLGIMEYLRAHPGLTFVAALAMALGASFIIILVVRGIWNRRMLAAAAKANRDLEGQLSIVEALSRDYSNVLALNEERAGVRIVKLKGYVPEGLEADPDIEQDYGPIMAAYVRDRVHPADREYVTRALDLQTIGVKLAQMDTYTGSYRVVKGDETHYFQFICVRIRENLGFAGAFILVGFRNIDEMIAREQRQKAALREALAQARYASAAKTAFLNNMSHDIRTPMNAIIGFTELASRHLENISLVRGYLGRIMTSSNHLLSLINDVLDMSRIESGKMEIEEKEVPLPEIVHDLRTIVQSDVKSRQLAFHIDAVNVVNETVICDRLRINRVLLNILGNAMKYTLPGGSVSMRVIQAGCAHDGVATYEFKVADTGIGMSPEFLAHVFEPFEREQTSTVSGIQGTGLGLAITKKIVDIMGGAISVTSEPGKGSEFTVSMRFRVVENPQDDKRLPQYEGKRALVVDADMAGCDSMCKMLSSLGLRPEMATRGGDAIARSQLASAGDDPYSVFFIDLSLPDMNGIELARSLRGIIPMRIPIIILSSQDWGELAEEAHEAGVTAFFFRPVFLSGLVKLLANPAQDDIEGEDSETGEENYAGRRILLAEDNEMNQEIAQMVLEGAGFLLDVVENGEEAVRRMEEKPAGTYDLILMDVQMPVMNGYDATLKIRGLKDSEKASIPILAMTANAFEEDRKQAMASGMNGYISKPVDIRTLMKELKKVFRES